MTSGSAFHRVGPAQENERRPYPPGCAAEQSAAGVGTHHTLRDGVWVMFWVWVRVVEFLGNSQCVRGKLVLCRPTW